MPEFSLFSWKVGVERIPRFALGVKALDRLRRPRRVVGISLRIRPVHEIVDGRRIDAERFHPLRLDLIVADHEVKSVQSRRAAFRAQTIQSLRRLLHAAEALDQVHGIVHHQHGLPLNAIVVRPREVLGDPAVAELVERLVVNRAAPLEAVPGLVRDRIVPSFVHVVVRPHDEELHLAVVRCPEKALVERILEEGTSLVPVPVVDEDVDPVRNRRVDLLRDVSRIGLVRVAPHGLARLFVSSPLRLRLPDALPLALAGLEDAELRPARFGLVRRPHVGRHVVILRSCGREGEQQRGNTKGFKYLTTICFHRRTLYYFRAHENNVQFWHRLAHSDTV